MYLPSLVLGLLGFGLTASTSPIEERSNRSKAPAGCLTVGSSGTYATIGAALSALGSSTSDACIFIGAGTYQEQITIDYKGKLTMYGETTDTSSYKQNLVTITHSISSPEAGSLDKSATVNVRSDGFKMYNINVINGYGKGAQAVTLVANADKLGFYGCSFVGYQDTLYAKAGRQYYSNCYIEGAVDYIFGDASAWFGECDLVSVGRGYITAMSRTTADETTWYAIDHCNIYGKPGVDLTSAVYLGRPWRVLARVIFQNSQLSNIINPKGWSPMATGATPLYYEYNNKGAGADTSKREYESPISGAVSIATVLGGGWNSWVDTTY
ncbi:hypothetical protein KXW98_004138 [Aspergillus fumigatus]|nr:hypothetical protein CNMCM8057_007571 [Aspergillus fumigatus]KAF4294218.1 hypothetical protein CNMCM8686_004166 [Aspergillus fumigatus]KAH1371224.1 hypothetical protein KXX14_007298 [Aspergillus fumigatus]KAH1376813.1 hypothetical protein KXX10_000835 [Aspergillus fumigatus]KAH1437691.1 hypothetical protein KXX32_001625 [Aspergillus fumigatus]